jgi:IMP dehydrogenase/GMP reductase
MKTKVGLTFDDVLLIPKHSTVKSRKNVDLSTTLGNVSFNIPVISANMKNVTGPEMCIELLKLGGMPIMHRFYDSDEEQISALKKIIDISKGDNEAAGLIGDWLRYRIGVSIGIGSKAFDLASKLIEFGARIVCIDIAHGDHNDCLNTINDIKKSFPNVLLIAGNIATASGAQNLYDSGADVVKCGIGGGCFAAGTRILMANGCYKNIEEIKPGDRVINMNGHAVNVKAAFSTGVKKVSKIRHTLSHKNTYVTPDHRFYVGDLNSVTKQTIQNHGYAKLLATPTRFGESKLKWKQIGEVKQDTLLMPKNINFELSKYFEIKLNKRSGGNQKGFIYELDAVLEPSYELGYTFGTFLGDGCASCAVHNNSHIDSVHWYFGKNELDIANKLAECIKKLFKKDIKVEEQENIITCSFYYKPFADFLFGFGKKNEKHLPHQYLINDKQYLQGISDGLIDSDGHIEKCGRTRLTNTSEQITELFGIITYLLSGILPNKTNRGVQTGNLNIENFHENHQISKLLEYTETDIETEVFDLTIDCDTHSFIANNAIVHNSLCTTRVETGNGVPQLTALEEVYEQSDRGKKFKIIADGGIRNAGDAIKALVFSHAVMLGNVLAGTDEAPGQTITVDGQTYKTYAGSSTHKINHIEGVTGLVPSKGPVKKVLEHLLDGIRSGCSYQGAHNLDELRKDPEFVLISNAGLTESKPHDIIVLR